MNKILTKVVGLVLGLSFAVGGTITLINSENDSAVAKAADSTATWTATSGALGTTIASVNGTATGTITDSESNSWSYTRTLTSLKSGKSDYVAFSSGYIQLGSNNALETLTLQTTAISGTVSSVNVFAYGSNHMMSISVGGTSYYSSTLPASAPSSALSGTGSSSGTITISFTATSYKALYIKSISVVHTTSSTLSSLNLTGPMSKTTYYVGDSWDSTGLVATATFSDSTTQDVSSSVTYSYSPATATDTSVTSVEVTASYTNSGVTKTATYTQTGITVNTITSKTYALVTSTSDLIVGAKYLIASETTDGYAYVMSTQNNNNRAAVSIPVSSNVATVTTQTVVEITLGGSSGAWTFLTDDGYLYAAGSKTTSSNNYYLRSQATNDENGQWAISISSGVASIVAQGSNTNNELKYNSSSTLFSCYASGNTQKDVYLYRTTDKYVTSIAMSGSMTKTSYSTVSKWDPTGLTVTATYNDSSTEDITSNVTWSYSPATPAEGVTSVVATATLGELTATSGAQTVSVISVSTPYLNGVAYKMYFYSTSKSANYYFIGSMDTTYSYYGATSATKSEGVDVYFEANGEGQNIYFMSGSDKNYITVVSVVVDSSTKYNFNFSTTVPTTAWTFDGTSMVFAIDGTDYTLGNYGDNTNFAAFPASYSSNYRVEFELVTALTADYFAQLFLGSFTCDSTGVNAPTFSNEWNSLNATYLELSVTEQATLKDAVANESGTTVQQAMARYDYVVAKYAYTNFIERTITPSGTNPLQRVLDGNSAAIIVVITVSSVIALTACFYLRKRKSLTK